MRKNRSVPGSPVNPSKREEQAGVYISELAGFLGHHYWVFRVLDEYAPDGCWAEIHVMEYNEAEVRLSSKFWAASREEKTQILLHELMHISFSRINEHVEDAIESVLEWVGAQDRKKAKSLIEIHLKAAQRAEEVEVNRMAVLLAEFAPGWPLDI